MAFIPGGGIPPPDGMFQPDPYMDPSQQGWGTPTGFPQMQPPQPPPEPISDPEPPSKEFQKEAKDYVSKFCKASKAYVEKKKPSFEKFLQLYNGNLSVFAWQKGVIKDPDTSQSRVASFMSKGGEDGDQIGLTDYVHPVAPLVHAYAHNAFLSIFSGPEYFTVNSEDEQGGVAGDDQFPTEYKVQQLLLRKLDQGKIFASVFKSLVKLPLYGTVAAKIYWHSHKVPRWKWDLTTFQKIHEEETVYECPILQPIPLDRWLPDPQALSSDINLWRGVGHRVARTWEDINAAFARGTYTLNEDKFKERWKDGKGGDTDLSDDLGHDNDADQEKDETLYLDIWEWHGRVPSKGQGLVECCCTIVTEKDSDDPEDGIMIRLTTEPLLSSGLRPFVCSHWVESDSVFANGLICENEDTLFTLSQLIGQLEDVARHTSIPIRATRTGSPAREFMLERGVLQPGDNVPYDDPNDFHDFPALNVPTADIVRLIQMFRSTLEQESGQTSTFQGVATGDQTATGMSILQKQSAAPNSTKTQLFAANYLQPALNIALGMLQQFTLTDQTIMIQDYGGEMKPITVTAEELQRGKYTVKVTLTDQSQTRTVTAQSAERMLQALPNLQQMFQREGWEMSAAEVGHMWVDGLDTKRGERVFRKIGTPEQALQQQIQQLEQQLADKDKKPPSISIPIPFVAMPPDAQVQALALAGINVSPQEMLPFPGMMPVGGQQPGNGGPPGVSPQQTHPGFNGGPLAEHGGPMGPEPNDQNADQQALQLQMQMQAPGQPMPGQGGGMQ